jgi:putative oxidoreductase
MLESLTGTHADWVVGIARLVLGIIFFAHGAQKLLGWFGGPGLANSMRTFTEHLRLPSTLAFLVIAGEFFSGIGLIVGLFSRIAALVIALTMVGAIASVHWRFGLFLNWFGTQEGHGIEYHLLAIALALIVVVKGAGAFSLDRVVYEHFSGSEQSAAAADNGGGRYREGPKVGRHRPEGHVWTMALSRRGRRAATAGLKTELALCGAAGHSALPGVQDYGTRYFQLCGCPTGSE